MNWIKQRITLREKIAIGDKTPKHLGFAWYHYDIMASTYYIMPLNWIMRWLRDFYYFIRRGVRTSHLERLEQELYKKHISDHVKILETSTTKMLQTTAEWKWECPTCKHTLMLVESPGLNRTIEQFSK